MKKDNTQEESTKGGVGRTAGSNAHEETSNKEGRDISEIDQQEGDMHNGTLGGNFGKEEQREKVSADE